MANIPYLQWLLFHGLFSYCLLTWLTWPMRKKKNGQKFDKSLCIKHGMMLTLHKDAWFSHYEHERHHGKSKGPWNPANWGQQKPWWAQYSHSNCQWFTEMGGGNVTVVLSHFHCYLCGGSCTSPRASYMAGCISPRWIGSSSCSHFSSDSSQSDLWWAHIVFVLKNPQLSFNGVP